jgi:ammonium transporter Rh
MFGAYFGLTAAKVLGAPHDPSGLEGSSITSDLLSLVGTVFLWLYWPSFNAGALTGNTDEAARATTNTIIGLLASCVACFITSGTISGKFSPADIQNATLAGGVAVGAVARMDIGLGWASIIGAAGGAISTLGYQFVQPFLQSKLGLHDTCGVHNLHGMPAVFGGVISIIMAEAKYDSSILVNGKGEAGGYQAAAIGVSFAVAIAGGAVAGILMKITENFMKSMVGFTPPKSIADDGHHFADKSYWMVADNTTESSSTVASKA